jgi:hypothetical protein
MDKIQKNVIQLTNTFYSFQVRDPKYSEINFFPRIYISRESDKVIKLYVEIYESNQKTFQTKLRRLLSYNETVKDQEKYFQLLQNSQFNLAIPQSLVFLEKCVTAIKQIVQKQSGVKDTTDVSVNVEPTSSSCPIYLFVAFGNYDTAGNLISVFVQTTYTWNNSFVDQSSWKIDNSDRANAEIAKDFTPNPTPGGCTVNRNKSPSTTTTTVSAYYDDAVYPNAQGYSGTSQVTIDWGANYSTNLYPTIPNCTIAPTYN